MNLWAILSIGMLVVASANLAGDAPAGSEEPRAMDDAEEPCEAEDFEARKHSARFEVIGLSSQQVHREFHLDSRCKTTIWAEWNQPYTTITFRLTDESGTLYQHHWQHSLGDAHEHDMTLGPGDYRLELRVFGAHAYQDFAIGADFHT